MAIKGMPQKKNELKTHEGTATVTVQTPEGAEVITEEKVSKSLFDEQPVVVSVGAGLTINTGNYSSARCEVHISVPCANENQAVEDTYEFCKYFVDTKISEIRDQIEEGMAASKKK